MANLPDNNSRKTMKGQVTIDENANQFDIW